MNGRSLLLGTLIIASAASPAWADDQRQACIANVAELRVRAAALPPEDLSRRFAENNLDTALSEMAAGDVDECQIFIERALKIIDNRPYRLRPGEMLDGYGRDARD